VSVLPGEACSAQPSDDTFLRLAFSNPDPGRIRTGIARLAAAFDRVDSGGDRGESLNRLETRPLV
jgi:DNA-binding transcriptional MocR family regulator